jgi:mRNA-degrading endonuclease RelE of RelBE toxin-antitoxin system
LVRILISRSAERELARLPRDVQQRFADAFDELERDPRPRPGLDVRPLRGMKGAWRLRVGSYRGIYERGEGELRFTRFGHRKDVYRV